MSADEDFPANRASAAGDESAGQAGHHPPSLPDVAPDRDRRSLFEAALDSGRDASGRATRTDGWTPERIATFLQALARAGTVAEAAAAAGMGVSGAYALRNSAKGRPFALAWDAAVLRAGASLADALTTRAMHGWDEPIFHEGKICGHRRRYDNRRGTRLLNRHDRREAATDRNGAAARLVAEEFEPFVKIVAAGGEGAVDFVGERLFLAGGGVGETDLLERADNFHRYGAALACEIDVSDLDPADRANWSDEQVERARRSGLVARLEKEKRDAADDGTPWNGSGPE